MIATDSIPTDLPGYVEHGYRLGWSFTPLNGKTPIHTGWQRAPREPLRRFVNGWHFLSPPLARTARPPPPRWRCYLNRP